MIRIVSLAKTFWGSIVTDETPHRAGVATAIERGARADGARITSQSATVADNIAHEAGFLAHAEPYSVVRSRFYMAFFLMLPLGMLIDASWQLTLFALEIIPNETVRNMTAMALVGATLLSIHLLLESLKRSGWVPLALTALCVVVLASVHYQLAKARAAVIADWILNGDRTVIESAAGTAVTQTDPTSLTSSAQWGSGWLELDALTDLRRGETLRLALDGTARKVVVRFLSRADDPNSPNGVDGGALDVSPSGVVELTLKRDHLATRQVSAHGGVNPWGLYRLGGGNGPVVLLSVERVCSR